MIYDYRKVKLDTIYEFYFTNGWSMYGIIYMTIGFSADSASAFKTRLGKFWSIQKIIYDYHL